MNKIILSLFLTILGSITLIPCNQGDKDKINVELTKDSRSVINFGSGNTLTAKTEPLSINKIVTKSLTAPFMPDLDNLSLEAVSVRMEQNVEKHGINCCNWANDFPYHPITVFTIAYSDKYIFVDFFVRGNFLRAENYKNNSPVCEDSCVEFFLKNPDNKEYWNFEFNCIGTINASHREQIPSPVRLTDEQLLKVKRYASCGTKPFQEMKGLFAWNLVVAIPFDLIGIDENNIPEYIEGNFNKCGIKTGAPHFLSWSPIDTPNPDFHRPEFFGKIYLEKK